MHPRVFLDDGYWTGMSGPQGSSEMRLPTFPADQIPARHQTARERAAARGRPFSVAMAPEGMEPQVFRTMVQSPATIHWQATFEPIKRELPRAYEWLDFIPGADLYPDDKRIVRRMSRDDDCDQVLVDRIPDAFSRRLVIGSANFNLVLGARIGAAVSMDRLHREAVEAKIEHGEANPVFGAHALVVQFPDLGDLSWEDIDAARELPGLPALRALLAEIEEAAWQAAESGMELDEAVRQLYVDRFHEAVREAQMSFRGTVAGLVIGGVLSLVTGPMGPIAGIATGATVDIAEAVARRESYQRSWMAAADDLRRRAGTVNGRRSGGTSRDEVH